MPAYTQLLWLGQAGLEFVHVHLAVAHWASLTALVPHQNTLRPAAFRVRVIDPIMLCRPIPAANCTHHASQQAHVITHSTDAAMWLIQTDLQISGIILQHYH